MEYVVKQHEVFAKWLTALRDAKARQIILDRIERFESGLFGDVKCFDNICEARIKYGPGYRLYYIRDETTVIIMLCGGDKGSQKRDIKKAKELANG